MIEISNSGYRAGKYTPSGRPLMEPLGEENLNGSQWKEMYYFLIPVFIWITHMLFVDLNDNFSWQEFDRLLCRSSVKGCSENTMRKTTGPILHPAQFT